MVKIFNNVIKGDKGKCVGCGVCKEVCPRDAIKMEINEEGFLYPNIDKRKCINCNLCQRKCPVLNNQYFNLKKDSTYAYCSKDMNNFLNSTSGGAFYDICTIWNDIHTETIIYGAYLDDSFHLYHIATDIDNISKIQKSKYIQSEIYNTLSEIKVNLENNKSVIFSGTPCQIAALKNYLNKEYERLLLIDVVCHGVASEDVFKKCLKYQEKKLNKSIIKYNFRFKNNIHIRSSHRYNVQYIFSDRTSVISDDDLFMKLFLKGSCLRDSCADKCIFKAKNSYSDISLGDLNNKSNVLPQLYDSRNYSSIFTHTQKGKNIVLKLKQRGRLIECDEEKVAKFNKVYYENCKELPNRKIFFEKYIKNNMIIDDSYEQDEFCIKKSNKHYIDLCPYIIKYLINNIKEFFINEKK